MTKGQLWDQLKAELWREGQGLHKGGGVFSTDSESAKTARALYDRMLIMETFAGATVELGRGAEALVAGYGRG